MPAKEQHVLKLRINLVTDHDAALQQDWNCGLNKVVSDHAVRVFTVDTKVEFLAALCERQFPGLGMTLPADTSDVFSPAESIRMAAIRHIQRIPVSGQSTLQFPRQF